MQERLKVYEEKMNKSYDALLNEYTSIRAGRANPHVLDKIKVDYYGAPTPLQQVANISVPEPRMILIQPWEKKLIKDIEKAILTSDLGINPNNDGSAVRLIFPELTEERRKDLAKDVKKKGEGAKVAVRNIRRDANDLLKKLEKGGEITVEGGKVTIPVVRKKEVVNESFLLSEVEYTKFDEEENEFKISLPADHHVIRGAFFENAEAFDAFKSIFDK